MRPSCSHRQKCYVRALPQPAHSCRLYLHATRFCWGSGACASVNVVKTTRETTIAEQNTVREITFMQLFLFRPAYGSPAKSTDIVGLTRRQKLVTIAH